ncbi:putative sister chromatid cohesion protein Dcc1 [Aspergillus foveolatus]|uniref:putative sister chromatid cohesion protein Dcc1 n=1 Tax=Aspergillus foveolatus TaxID=210207 RepID=UPI003CCDF1EF
MSTQSTPSILFTHQTPQQGFRLLELPPELAELLSSDNPPTLELKSPAPSTTNTSNATASEYVNLCTATQTYSIRQVQSSNSLHILRPSNGVTVRKNDLKIVAGNGNGAGDGDGENVDMDADTDRESDRNRDVNLNVEGTVTSIAKCGSTLELHKPAEGFSAVPYLEKLVRVFDRGDWEDMNGGESADEGITGSEATKARNEILDRIFADVPVSRTQCERDWVEMCTFILLSPTATEEKIPAYSCWRPSAAMRLDVWKRVVEGAVLQGIDLEKQFIVSDLWKSVLDDDGVAPFPRPLFDAVALRICELGDEVERAALLEMKWTSIKKEACVRWVGETYLEATATSNASAIAESEFLNAWKDQLPESWREDVSIAILPVS